MTTKRKTGYTPTPGGTSLGKGGATRRVKAYPITGAKVDMEKSIITGYASVFDVVDLQGEVVKKGAFAAQLAVEGAAPKVKVLYQHDHYQPIGLCTVLKEDDYGLYFEAKISRTPKGLECLQLADDGVIDQMSIGYDVKGWNEDKDLQTQHGWPVINLTELDLSEISPVTFAANPAARIDGVKGIPLEKTDSGGMAPVDIRAWREKRKKEMEETTMAGASISKKNMEVLEALKDKLTQSLADVETLITGEAEAADDGEGGDDAEAVAAAAAAAEAAAAAADTTPPASGEMGAALEAMAQKTKDMEV